MAAMDRMLPFQVILNERQELGSGKSKEDGPLSAIPSRRNIGSMHGRLFCRGAGSPIGRYRGTARE
jgi:hypothetical protein